MTTGDVTIEFEYPVPKDTDFAGLFRITFFGDPRAADAFCEACKNGTITRATVTTRENYSRRVI